MSENPYHQNMLASFEYRVWKKTCQVVCEDEEKIGPLGLMLRSATHDEIKLTGNYGYLLSYQCRKVLTIFNWVTGHPGYLILTFCATVIRNAPH
jgi:hypothetical protein